MFNQTSPSTPSPPAASTPRPSAETAITGSVGILKCESAGPRCNTVTLLDSSGKEWDLILTSEQNEKIRAFKQVKVYGKVTQTASYSSIEVTSYESLE